MNAFNTSDDVTHPDPQRDSLVNSGLDGVLDPAAGEIAPSRNLGIAATKKLPGKGFKRV